MAERDHHGRAGNGDPAAGYAPKGRGGSVRGRRAVSLLTMALVVAVLIVGIWALLEVFTVVAPDGVADIGSDSVVIRD